jgi:Flp pilus assembly CpaF family ATPase
LRKDLGEVFLAALEDPETVEIVLNADGMLWQERLGQPLEPIGTMSAGCADAAMRTIAAYHHATITRDNPTTVLDALIRELTDRFPKERLIIIEDNAEIQCAARDFVQYHTSPDRTLTHLVRMALRMRPDRIGAARGPEALGLLMAWNTGHEGGIATLHANNAAAGLTRPSTLVSMHRSVVEGHAQQIDKHHCDQEAVVCL